MKAIIILLSFMFVSSVTANTETRELSGVNPEPLNESEPMSEKHLKLVGDYEDCMDYCTANGGSSRACHSSCEGHCEGVVIRCNKIEVQNPIKLADYATCKHGCERMAGCSPYSDCHASEDCHDICSE